MTTITCHRGPDATGNYVDQVADGRFLALGHNRLSIIDLSEHAAQPMTTPDGRYTLVYNGEVYNYRELARELAGRELLDVAAGDTAVVLTALVEWGADALARFNGMWALVLYDRQAQTLLISRDRFGKKPLYYYQDGDSVFLASEIKAILSATDRRFSINAHVAIPFLTRGLVDVSNHTLFEDVKQFPAAGVEVIHLDRTAWTVGSDFRRYWRHPFEMGFEPTRGAVSPGQIRDLFLDAVSLRLRSDVPVGILLSGGLDSSSILGAVAELRSLQDVAVLSVISDDREASEEPFIDAMTAHVGAEAHKFNASTDPLDLLDDLPSACWYNDGPISSLSSLTHLALMKMAKKKRVKVLLTGQGADEQLGGYNKFFYFYLLECVRQGRLLSALTTVAQFSRNSSTLAEFRLSEATRYIGRKRLAKTSFIAAAHRGRDTLDIGYNGSYARREWIDITKTSVPALLHSEDRMSMSQSLEMRVPFLDYRLVELLAGVHPSEKFEGGWTKAIFRQAIEGLVPKEIQYRRDKKGFKVPSDAWMRGDLKGRMHEMFRSELLLETAGLVESGKLLRMYEAFTEGRGHLNGRMFFRAYSLEVFMRTFSESLRA
jgi:asparagine synthase (glutamine-hydrolysing)